MSQRRKCSGRCEQAFTNPAQEHRRFLHFARLLPPCLRLGKRASRALADAITGDRGPSPPWSSLIFHKKKPCAHGAALKAFVQCASLPPLLPSLPPAMGRSALALCISHPRWNRFSFFSGMFHGIFAPTSIALFHSFCMRTK